MGFSGVKCVQVGFIGRLGDERLLWESFLSVGWKWVEMVVSLSHDKGLVEEEKQKDKPKMLGS